MSLFRKNIIASYSAQAVAVACNFICLVLSARMLGKSGQGDLALYVSFTAFITLVIGLGLPSAIVFFIASKKIEKGKIIPIITAITLLMLIGFALFFFLAKKMNLLSVFLPNFILENSAWNYVLILHLLLLMMNQYFNSLFQAENKFALSGIVSVIGSILLMLLYASKYFEWIYLDIESIYWILGSLFIVTGLQYFIYIFSLYKTDKTYFSFLSFSFSEIKPMLWFALIAYVANLVQFLNYKMDVWFINYFHHNKEMIGIYSLAVGLAQLVWLLPNAVHGVLYTFTSSDNVMQEKITRTVKTCNWLLVYAIGAGVAGYFLSIYLVPLLFGEAFAQASKIIGILLIGIVPFASAMGVSAFFAGIQKIKINLFGSMIGLIFCLVLDIILIPRYGIEGAAYASVVSYLSTSVFFYIIFYKKKQVTYSE